MKKIISFFIFIGKPLLKIFKVLFSFKIKKNSQKNRKKVKNIKLKKNRIIRIDRKKNNPSWKYPSLFLFTLLVTALLLWTYQKIFDNLPNINEIYNPPQLSTKVYDRHGKLLYQFHENEDRSWIRLSQIPNDLVLATLAIEDKEFYEHHGLSLRGIIRATIYNFKKTSETKPRGGSTISQQLVKNIFFDGEKSWERKIKEAILAIMLESKLSKNEILERYFNQVPYGGNIYGVAEAAIRYLGKKVEDLNLAESAFLAGLPAAPSSYSPFSQDGFKLAKLRQEHVLNEMVGAKLLDFEKAEITKKMEIKIIEEKRDILAPHFVFYIKNCLEKLGFTEVGRRGLKVITSLDYEIQKEAEKIVKEEVAKASKLKITNGASVVLDVKTGEILALVGSKDYFATDIDGKFDVTTQALRQPGSSIKPINYLLALKRGKNLWDTIEDKPVRYKIAGQKDYTPQNYTGKYLGTVTLRTALASSLNVPSVKLLSENGVDKMIDLAEDMGISTWTDRSRFGLSLALGAGEVKVIEMAQAYSVFANLGNKVEVNPILQIDNYLGENIYKKEKKVEKIASEIDTFLINSALSDNQARAPIFGSNSLLQIKSKTVAVKTGTTNSLKDNWCIGWTPTYLVAVWVGNNDSSPMSWVASGISGATPIWNRTMRSLIESKKDENWETPIGLYKVEACGKNEWFHSGNEKKIKCISPTPTPILPI
ncbi:MAG: transglycosylase domain-containing protein [Candidatus Shapirobacteria bacterium]|nr:transglycosylase domain-containing protein [Candidatus Shapirobacteria bacterium]